MRKRLIWGVTLLSVGALGMGTYSVIHWIRRSSPYGVSEQANRNKTGSAVYWTLLDQDEQYLFVRDFKRSSKPQFLCHMNYTSTQGSYNARWSKDGQMLAVFNESALHFPELKMPKWVVGYDWQRGQILHSQQIVAAFAQHQGLGTKFDASFLRTPTKQEVEQFKPEKLKPNKLLP